MVSPLKKTCLWPTYDGEPLTDWPDFFKNIPTVTFFIILTVGALFYRSRCKEYALKSLHSWVICRMALQVLNPKRGWASLHLLGEIPMEYSHHKYIAARNSSPKVKKK